MSYYIDKMVLGEDIIIHRNPDTKNKKNWYVRILMKDGYVRRSLKTANKEKAIRTAWKIHQDVKEKEWFGLSHKKITFKAAALSYQRNSKHLSESRQSQIVSVCDRYLLPYFGSISMDEMHDNKHYINQYPKWRYDYWDEYDKRVLKGDIEDARFMAVNGQKPEWKTGKRPVSNYRQKPATATIKMDILIFNRIMKHAADMRMIKYPELMTTENLPKQDVRSQSIYTFSDDEINKIRRYFQNEYRRNKKYIIGKNGERIKDKDGNDTYTLYEDARPQTRHKMINLRGFFYLAVNTGMRVRELNFLTWGCITQKRSKLDDGSYLDYLSIFVEEYKTARRNTNQMHRIVYAPHHLTKILNDVRRQNAPHNKDDDYVFNYMGGKQYLQLTRIHMRLLFQELGVYEHHNGSKRTAKHFRSYYASKLLQTKPIHTVAAALGHSITSCFKFYSQLEIAKKAYEMLADIPQPNSVVMLVDADD